MELMIEQEDLNKLKLIMPRGIAFNVSAIQRQLSWGFNRSYRTFLFAIDTGEAKFVDDACSKIMWI